MRKFVLIVTVWLSGCSIVHPFFKLHAMTDDEAAQHIHDRIKRGKADRALRNLLAVHEMEISKDIDTESSASDVQVFLEPRTARITQNEEDGRQATHADVKIYFAIELAHCTEEIEVLKAIVEDIMARHGLPIEMFMNVIQSQQVIILEGFALDTGDELAKMSASSMGKCTP